MEFSDCDALAASLRRALNPPDSDELTLTQSVVWVAWSVRQLADAHRLSLTLQRRTWPVRLHWWANGNYELGASRAAMTTTMRLCGMVIHNMVLTPAVDAFQRPAGFYFTTQLTREEGLFYVEWSQLRQMVELTCHELGRPGVIHAA